MKKIALLLVCNVLSIYCSGESNSDQYITSSESLEYSNADFSEESSNHNYQSLSDHITFNHPNNKLKKVWHSYDQAIKIFEGNPWDTKLEIWGIIIPYECVLSHKLLDDSILINFLINTSAGAKMAVLYEVNSYNTAQNKSISCMLDEIENFLRERRVKKISCNLPSKPETNLFSKKFNYPVYPHFNAILSTMDSLSSSFSE